MCKYSNDTGYECPHKRLEGSDYCIFHLQDDNKDVDEFNKGIKEIFKNEDLSINLNGFYFPYESSDFTGQKFKKNIIFRNATFSGRADFGGATFIGADFNNATFSEGADFGEVTFSVADFRNATFSGSADLGGATFKEAWFGKATFEEANFECATFSKTYFNDATFSGKADFDGITVLVESSFLRTTFSEVNFGLAMFSGDITFNDVAFSGNVSFKHAKLMGKINFIPDKNETIIFENTYFSDDVRIKADLSKCSFANSNVERVDMTDSTWIVDNNPKDSYKIWEQRQGELSSNWKELEGIYRRLKQSYQRFGDNDTAGNFYYREMECKRQQLKGAKRLFWDVFYKLLCGYGEKPFNVIWASLAIIFAASLFFFYWGIELLGSDVLNLTPRLINYDLSLNFQWVITNIEAVFKDWLECLYTSVITFTTLGYGDVHPIGSSRIVASVEAGFGIIMTALFIFVFTRKMLR